MRRRGKSKLNPVPEVSLFLSVGPSFLINESKAEEKTPQNQRGQREEKRSPASPGGHSAPGKRGKGDLSGAQLGKKPHLWIEPGLRVPDRNHDLRCPRELASSERQQLTLWPVGLDLSVLIIPSPLRRCG